MRIIVNGSTGNSLSATHTRATLISLGIAGPPGPPGPGSVKTVIASENLGGHRAITITGFHCSPADSDRLAGVTPSAVTVGLAAVYVDQGLMEEPSWAWTPGLPIFVGLTGNLTQSPLTTGLLRRIAWAVTPTLINIDFASPINQA